MKWTTLLIALALSCLLRVAEADDPITIDSPGLAPSHIHRDGLLQEDWGTLDVQLIGDGLSSGTATVRAIQLDDVIPAAQISSDHGPVQMIRTVYRAPIHPAGVDVLLLELAETANAARDVTVRLKPSVGMKQGERVGASVDVLRCCCHKASSITRRCCLGATVTKQVPCPAGRSQKARAIVPLAISEPAWAVCQSPTASASHRVANCRSCSACAKATGPKVVGTPCSARSKALKRSSSTRL